MFVQGILAVFDSNHDNVVHLTDFVVVLSRMFLGTLEEKLLQGFGFYDRQGYGDFSKDDLSEILRVVVSLYSDRTFRKPQQLKSSYFKIYFDNNEVADKGSDITLLVDSTMTVSGLIKFVLKEKNYMRQGSSDSFGLYTVRLHKGAIIYQKRLEESERPFDIRQKWTNMDLAEAMRLYLVYNPPRSMIPSIYAVSPTSPMLPPSSFSTPSLLPSSSFLHLSPPSAKPERRRLSGHSLIRTSSRNNLLEVTLPPNTHLPFKTARTDTFGRGYVTVAIQGGSALRLHEEQYSLLQGFSTKKFVVTSKTTTEEVIELAIKETTMESQSGMDFFLYEIHATEENTVYYERPMAYSEHPLMVTANTPEANPPAKFMIVPRTLVRDFPFTATNQRG